MCSSREGFSSMIGLAFKWRRRNMSHWLFLSIFLGQCLCLIQRLQETFPALAKRIRFFGHTLDCSEAVGAKIENNKGFLIWLSWETIHVHANTEANLNQADMTHIWSYSFKPRASYELVNTSLCNDIMVRNNMWIQQMSNTNKLIW